MKLAFSIIFIFSTLVSLGQNLSSNPEDGLVSYVETIEVPGVSKIELLERAKTWLNQTSSSVSFISEEMGMISIGSEMPYAGSSINKNISLEGRVVYVATIIIQDGIFMYEYNNFFHEANPNRPHATDLGFLTTYDKNTLDLASSWKEGIMRDLHKKVEDTIHKQTESLKKIMLNEKSSLSLNLQSK